MRTFNLIKCPYEEGIEIYKKSRIELKPGVTVLVGCNGAGKTTFLRFLEAALEKKKIPVMKYDNLFDGGDTARQVALSRNELSLLATLATSSEGEQIYINMSTTARKIGQFVNKNKGAEEIWLLFDAIDSGLSVDNIVEMKEFLFDLIISDNPNTDVYIVVSANEYEMCREEECFDVHSGQYVKFTDYEEYRAFILNSRKEKDKRYPD